jgi:outer membrane murein-binding lipoprotein Lpp
MGKKKDKAAKLKKKKSRNEPVLETETSSIEAVEPEPEHESDPGDIQYAEYVTAQDVMELVNSLSHDIEQLTKSNQSLQKEITQKRKQPYKQFTVLMIIALILGIGMVAVGYNTAKVNALMGENMGIVSARMDQLKLQFDTMNTSMVSMSGDLDQLNTRLNNLSANVSTIDQNVSKVASDVSKINTDATGKTYDSRYMGRPIDPRSPWR